MNATRPISLQIATSFGRRGGYYPPAGDKLSPLRILSEVFYILQHALCIHLPIPALDWEQPIHAYFLFFHSPPQISNTMIALKLRIARTAKITTYPGSPVAGCSASVGTVVCVTGSVGCVVGTVGAVEGDVGCTDGFVGCTEGSVGSVEGFVDGSVVSWDGSVGSVVGSVDGPVVSILGTKMLTKGPVLVTA